MNTLIFKQRFKKKKTSTPSKSTKQAILPVATDEEEFEIETPPRSPESSSPESSSPESSSPESSSPESSSPDSTSQPTSLPFVTFITDTSSIDANEPLHRQRLSDQRSRKRRISRADQLAIKEARTNNF